MSRSSAATAPVEGPVCYLGKYREAIEKACSGDPFKLPESFRYADVMLAVGDPPINMETVVGRIWNYVKVHQPISGRALAEALLLEDWKGHPSAYASSGKVCSLWVTGYISGMLRPSMGHLVVLEE